MGFLSISVQWGRSSSWNIELPLIHHSLSSLSDKALILQIADFDPTYTDSPADWDLPRSLILFFF